MMPAANARAVLMAALAYLALTIAYTWPLPIRFTGVVHDPGDPLLNAWILWWTTAAAPLTAHWWNAPIFFPSVGAFAFSEHLLGLAPLSAPVIALTGNALLGYNAALFASYVFSALGAYFLAYTLTRRHDAAFVAGLAFAFAPYRLAQLPHIQVLCAYWTPVCLAALHRYDRTGLTRWAALAALAWLMQALSNGYYMFFLSVLLALWFLWFALGRWPVAKLARIAGCFLLAAALLAPVLLGYRHILMGVYGFSRDIGTMRQFSADIGALLNASNELWLWGWVHAIRKPEGELFPGLTIVALCLFGLLAAKPFRAAAPATPRRRRIRLALALVSFILLIGALLPIFYGTWRLTIGGVRLVSIARGDKPLTLAIIALLGWVATLPRFVAAARRRSVLLFYTTAAVAMWAFALGPEPMFFGMRALYQAPYGWLMRLPGFDGLRVPARFWTMCLVCLAALAALAIDRLHGRARVVVTWIAAFGLILDGWPATFIVGPAPERHPTPPGVTARLVLPMDLDHDALSVYQQTFDGVPLYNGFSGYSAPHQYAMHELLHAHDPRILQALTARGALAVLVDDAADADGGLRRYVSAYPGAVLRDTSAGWSTYVLPGNSAPELVPSEQGQPIAIKALDAFPSPPHTPRAVDHDLKTRWSGGVQQSAADFTIELAEPGRVRQVVTELGEFMTDYPMRLQLDVSADGKQWDTVFLGDTALHAYYAAIHQPRSMPLVLPVDRDNVRFIRLKQLGWGKHDWSIAEVRVLR